ncbi:ClpP/crotonase-like domain-containing protein [Bisporella sp. PMI_857]|nr:ClpP/crotonase-like domain-containing protein [Bisporella sp. PMI_857]
MTSFGGIHSNKSFRRKMAPLKFKNPPPEAQYILISFPDPSILLITLNRPKNLNCISTQMHYGLDAIYQWLDVEPSLRCAILTGTGRAFCAGADLKEWNLSHQPNAAPKRPLPPSGFGGLSRRQGKKPVICAVNGICFGGGCEMVINSDITIADESATFGLPEVKIGVVALAGALTRLVRTAGRQRAMEMALTGRTVHARELERWGLVNKVVKDGACVDEAVRIARLIAKNSPDSVTVTREGVKMGWEGIGAEEGTRILAEQWYPRMDKGENMKEGIRAFVEKRDPIWTPSKL